MNYFIILFGLNFNHMLYSLLKATSMNSQAHVTRLSLFFFFLFYKNITATKSLFPRPFISVFPFLMITSTAHLLYFPPSFSSGSNRRRRRSLCTGLNDRRWSYEHNRYKNLTFVRGRRYFSNSTLFAKAAEFKSPSTETSEKQVVGETAVLLDVTGMMCGGCVSRVKSILSSDERVDSVVVNMLTETAAIKLKENVEVEAEEFAKRLTECGFPSKKRTSGLGIQEKVKKWKEMVEKKEALLVGSRNRVAFAWTLVALCCGSHASHILHSLGIHVTHGKLRFCLRISSFSCLVCVFVYLINVIAEMKFWFII